MTEGALNCKIVDADYYLPRNVVDNLELASRYPGWSEEKIYEKTGVRERHIVSDDEHVCDLAQKAAEKLFEKGTVKPSGVQAVILCTQSPDYALPATACILQERLGLSKQCLAFDFNQGCSGFVYGLMLAGAMIHAGIVNNALLITAETYSRWCHPMDKSVTTIFGDGAAAIYINRSEHAHLGPFVFGTDGRGYTNLIIPSSGSHKKKGACRQTSDSSGNIRNDDDLYMNGPELFRFGITIVPAMVDEILAKVNMAIEDIDKFIFHQASQYMLKSIQDKAGIPDDKMVYEMEHTGNVVSASIPIALLRSCEKGNIKKGQHLLLAGFGVGYSWAGGLIHWDPED